MLTVYRCFIFMLFAMLVGCGGGSSTTPPPEPQPVPVPVIETMTVDLLDYVGSSMRYVQAYSEGYRIPTASELAQFQTVVTNLINQNPQAALEVANSIGFRVLRLIDSGANNNELYCLEEVSLRGQGFYCVDLDSLNSHHVSVPHPLYDSRTNTQSVPVMRDTNARFLSISSTHRCSNAATSACSGTTSVCGDVGPYKVSDVAHNVDSFFYVFGTIIHDSSMSTHTLQLHGCGASTCPANNDNDDILARLSAGTTNNLPSTELVNVFTQEINDEVVGLQQGEAVSCSEVSDDKRLCGTTNTLGRYINGQRDSCQNSATNFVNSRWLHIEQNSNLRRDDGAGDNVTPNTLIQAINDAFEN